MSVLFLWVSGVMFGLALASGVNELVWDSLIAAVIGLALMLTEETKQ